MSQQNSHLTTASPPSEDLSGALWMWLPGDPTPNTYARFHGLLEHGAELESATLILSADTSYKLWINGTFVMMGPAREAPPFFYYDEVDLTPYLARGHNTLTLLSHYQGVPSHSYVPGNAGVLIKGWGRYRDGVCVDLGTPEGWHCEPAIEYSHQSQRLGSGVGFAEDYTVPDKSTPSGGSPIRPVIVNRYPDGPRSIGLRRDLPILSEFPMTPAKWLPIENGYILDFGQEVFGFVAVRGHAASSTHLTLSYGEHLSQGRVDHAKAGMDYRDRLRIPGGRFSWLSYEKRAMRYLQITGPADSIEDIRVVEYRYPYERQPYALISDTQKELKYRILDVSARTIELCSDDLLNDCPWRERAQYLDPYAYFGAMKKLFGTLAPAKRFLLQFARGARQRGRLPMCYPSSPSTTVIPDFTLGYVCALKDYAVLSGDLETVRDCFSTVQSVLEDIRLHEDDRGLLSHVKGWVFLDNSFELCRSPRSSALNALYAGALAQASLMANHLGLRDIADQYRERRHRLQQSWRETFFRHGQVLDSDVSPTFSRLTYLNYHYPADQGSWAGGSFVLRFTLDTPQKNQESVFLSFFNGCKVWIDGTLVFESAKGGDWFTPPLFNPSTLQVDGTCPHQWHIEVQHTPIDWEIYLGADTPLIPSPVEVAVQGQYGIFDPSDSTGKPWKATVFKPYRIPVRSQVSVAHAALWDLLDESECRPLLTSCLPTVYRAPYQKRTTPFFVSSANTLDDLNDTVLPCNTPWSLFFFCKALKRHGLNKEAESLLLSLYGQELDLGASTWWEEWGRNSSLCHAWGAFVADFLVQ